MKSKKFETVLLTQDVLLTSIQRQMDVRWTSKDYGRYGRQMDVETTFCAYWGFIYFYFLDVWEMLKDKKFDDVSRIIKEQPNIVNSMRGKGGVTFIMNAAALKRKDIVGYLSNQQYDLSIVDVVDAWNVLHYTVRFNKDDVAIEMLKSFDISQLNDDVINKRNDYKRTPLHYAAWKNNHKSSLVDGSGR